MYSIHNATKIPNLTFKRACKKMYLAVLWICVRVFDTDLGNGFCISSKYASLEKGDFKEIVKGDKYVQMLASVLTSNFVLY